MASGQGQGIFATTSCLILLLLMIEGAGCQPRPSNRRPIPNEAIFDVTNFNAKGDGKTDNAMPIMRAWVAACESRGPARVLIPRGNFMASEILFAGSCNGTKPITIEIQGTLLADTDLSSYTQSAWIMLERADGVILTGGGSGTIDARGQAIWKYGKGNEGSLLPVSVIFQTMQNARMCNLKLVNSMGFHLKVTDSKSIDITKLSITAPYDSPNTDGIHLTSSTNVRITNSVIGTGDDCVSIGHGTENILVAGVTCGPGHGLSVGSLGKREDETNVKGITISNCTLIGTTNGARIKSYHESPKIEATGIVFEDLVMKGVQNPILIDQHYDSKNRRQQSSVRLSDIHFRNIKGTSSSALAINLNCSSLVPCLNVELSNTELSALNSTIGTLTSACSNAQIFTRGHIIPVLPARCT